jgi:hypothetical protein
MAEPERPRRLAGTLATGFAAGLAAGMTVVSGIAWFGRRAPAPQAAEPEAIMSEAPEPEDSESGRGEPSVPPDPKAKSLGYETEDISTRMVGRILAGFAVTVVVSVTMLTVMIQFFRGADNADQPPLTTQQSADIIPPGPHMQNDPYRDLRQTQQAEEQKIGGYAWTDPAHTRARIPVARAMALVAGRSLEPSP